MMQFPGQLCGFLRRHKRKFIFAGVLVGGVIGSVKYAQYKIKQWMTEEEEKYLEEIRKQQHFEKTQEHCFAIAEAVVKALKDDILSVVNTEVITTALKQEKNPEKKIELWGELKITIFTKLVSCLYILVFSIAIIRIQLNHLAAKVYFNTSKNQEQIISDSIQRWFLSLSHEFIAKNKLDFITGEMKKICCGLAESMPLQCQVKGADIESMLRSTHDQIRRHQKMCLAKKSSHDTYSILDYFVPSDSDVIAESDPDLKKHLVDELWDILDSDDCMKVFESCILESFSNFNRIIDGKISENVACSDKRIALVTDTVPFLEPHESCTLPLAKVLPILNAQVNAIGSEMFIRKVLGNETLSRFSANIYQSFTARICSQNK